MFKEFKEFALKGNVLDLAIAVIIGGAFGKIVSSLVNDVIMPAIGAIWKFSFLDLKFVIEPATNDTAEVAIYYGAFIQSVVDFFIIAVSIFLFIKLLSSLKKKKIEEAETPKPSDEAIILSEIRDILKSK